jgi:epoxyqueuosine reductase
LSQTAEIARKIERKALELGFSACGFVAPEELVGLEPEFRKWLASGKSGEMNYLQRNIELRLDPTKLVEGAKTIISLAAGYYAELPSHTSESLKISRYALGDDYHQALKSRGNDLLGWIHAEIGPANGRVFTDSAPVFEREWARRAGIGWIGKNGCLIIPGQGSWFFLAEIIIDREVRTERTEVPDRCGTCRRCIEACPTHALAGDGSMDPRKCISYLTIEHRGLIPEEFKGKLENWIFGCDICQDVCPWNKNPSNSLIGEFLPRPGLPSINGSFIRSLTGPSFAQVFDGTPVLRAGFNGIIRNFEFLEKDECS